MMIRVMFKDSRYDMVKDFLLDALLEAGEIAKFRRSDGWVVIGRDPVRKAKTRPASYEGPERRGLGHPIFGAAPAPC